MLDALLGIHDIFDTWDSLEIPMYHMDLTLMIILLRSKAIFRCL